MENPNYYGILPANVRYDKNLKPMEKILYTELTALSNKNGYCKAQNSYFAKLYDVHKNTAGSWINNLEKSGYIKSKLIYAKDKEGKTTKQVIERRIYITVNPINEKNDTYQQKDCDPINKKIDTPINEKMEEINNNTSNEYYKNNNTIDNNIYSQIIDYLNEKANRNYRSNIPKNQRLIQARIKENFTVEDFKKVIDIKVQEWGKNEKMNKYLRPETLFGTKFESYLNEKEEKNAGSEKTGGFKYSGFAVD